MPPAHFQKEHCGVQASPGTPREIVPPRLGGASVPWGNCNQGPPRCSVYYFLSPPVPIFTHVCTLAILFFRIPLFALLFNLPFQFSPTEGHLQVCQINALSESFCHTLSHTVYISILFTSCCYPGHVTKRKLCRDPLHFWLMLNIFLYIYFFFILFLSLYFVVFYLDDFCFIHAYGIIFFIFHTYSFYLFKMSCYQ